MVMAATTNPDGWDIGTAPCYPSLGEKPPDIPACIKRGLVIVGRRM